MNEQDLKDYKRDFEKDNYEPYVIQLSGSKDVVNMPNSRNRHAWRGVSWIDYWRAMTGYKDSIACCASCRKAIYIDIKSEDSKRHFEACKMTEPDLSLDELEADGGHVLIEEDDEIYDGVYIAPLCKKCNHATKKNLTLQAGSIICAEVGVTLSKD